MIGDHQKGFLLVPCIPLKRHDHNKPSMPLAISCALKEIWPVPFYFKEFDVFKVLIRDYLEEKSPQNAVLRMCTFSVNNLKELHL